MSKDDRAFLRRLGIVLLAATVVFVLWRASTVFLLVFAGLLVGIMLETLEGWVRRVLPGPRAVSLLVVFVTLIAILAGGAWLVAPNLAAQTDRIIEQGEKGVGALAETIRSYEWGRDLLSMIEDGEPIAGMVSGIVSRIGSMLGRSVEILAGALILVMVGVFYAVNPSLYRGGFVRLFPPRRRDVVGEVLDRLGDSMRGWLFGQLLAMVFIGTLTWLGLTLLGRPNAFALAFIAALGELVPFLGPVLSWVPAFLLAFLDGWQEALWVTLLYIVIQQVENNLAIPLIQQRTVYLPPVITLFAIVFFGTLFGFLGVLVATPLVAVVYVLVKTLWIERALGEPIDVPMRESLPGEDEAVEGEDPHVARTR